MYWSFTGYGLHLDRDFPGDSRFITSRFRIEIFNLDRTDHGIVARCGNKRAFQLQFGDDFAILDILPAVFGKRFQFCTLAKGIAVLRKYIVLNPARTRDGDYGNGVFVEVNVARRDGDFDIEITHGARELGVKLIVGQ